MPIDEWEAIANAEQATIRVITETRNLRTKPFTPEDYQITTGKAWDDWLEGIEREFPYFKISDLTDRKDALIIYGGKETARLEKGRPNHATQLDECEKLKTKLNSYFTPKKNKHHARYLFLKLRLNHGETIAAYTSRLREQANDCEFEGNADERILEHLIQTCQNRALIQKANTKKWNLSQFLAEAVKIEDTSLQIRDMKFTEEVFVNWDRQHKKRGPLFSRKPIQRQQQPCNYCGRIEVYDVGKYCPAFGKKCKKCQKCQKYNHFAAVCRSSKSVNGRLDQACVVFSQLDVKTEPRKAFIEN